MVDRPALFQFTMETFSHVVRNIYFIFSLVPLRKSSKRIPRSYLCFMVFAYSAFVTLKVRDISDLIMQPSLTSEQKFSRTVIIPYTVTSVVMHMYVVGKREEIHRALSMSKHLGSVVKTKRRIFSILKFVWTLEVLTSHLGIRYLIDMKYHVSFEDVSEAVLLIGTILQLPAFKTVIWAVRYSFGLDNFLELELIGGISRKIVKAEELSNINVVMPPVDVNPTTTPSVSSTNNALHLRTILRIYQETRKLRLQNFDVFYLHLFWGIFLSTQFGSLFLKDIAASAVYVTLVHIMVVVLDLLMVVTLITTSIMIKYKHYSLVVKKTKQVFELSDRKSKYITSRFVFVGKDVFPNSPCVLAEIDLSFLSDVVDTITLVLTTVFVPRK